jgi:competence protein ComEC
MALLFDMTHLPGMAAWLSYRMPTPPLWVAGGFCAAFVLAGLALRFARRWVAAALAVCAIFVGLVAVDPFPPRLPHGALELTALDCGQGDALFLVFPDGTTMLLDAGGSRLRGGREGSSQGRRWDPGEDIVSPYLWSLGIKKIDVVVLSHPHQDHLGGLYAIFANFRVDEFWHAASPETPEYSAIMEAAAERGIPTRTLAAGDALTLGSASVRVLWPGLAPPSGHASQNDDSLVMRISANGMNFLLPGDADKVAEEELLASPESLESQVLKVAHHGSSTSSSEDFLARVAPRVAIISSGGPDNGAGGFPSSTTLEALHNVRARVFRTDIDGATTVEWKDGSLIVRTYRNPEGVVITGNGRPALNDKR